MSESSRSLCSRIKLCLLRWDGFYVVACPTRKSVTSSLSLPPTYTLTADKPREGKGKGSENTDLIFFTQTFQAYMNKSSAALYSFPFPYFLPLLLYMHSQVPHHENIWSQFSVVSGCLFCLFVIVGLFSFFLFVRLFWTSVITTFCHHQLFFLSSFSLWFFAYLHLFDFSPFHLCLVFRFVPFLLIGQ